MALACERLRAMRACEICGEIQERLLMLAPSILQQLWLLCEAISLHAAAHCQ